MSIKPIVVVTILVVASCCRGDELEDLYRAFTDENTARMKAKHQGEPLDLDRDEFWAIWLPKLVNATEMYPDSDSFYLKLALQDVAGILRETGRNSEALIYHERLIDLARTPQEKVHEMYQMGFTLKFAAFQAKFDGVKPRKNFDTSFAWDAIANWESLREYIEAEDISATHARLIPESMIYQASMYEFLEEHAMAARMSLVALERIQYLTEKQRKNLEGQSGPSGEFLLDRAAKNFAKCGESHEVFPLIPRLAEIPNRKQPLGFLWSRLLELDGDAFFDPALEWVRDMPDEKESPGQTISRLASEAKYVREDHALAYELMMLQLQHYPNSLSESTLKAMQQQQRFWLRDMQQEEGEQVSDAPPTADQPEQQHIETKQPEPVDEDAEEPQNADDTLTEQRIETRDADHQEETKQTAPPPGSAEESDPANSSNDPPEKPTDMEPASKPEPVSATKPVSKPVLEPEPVPERVHVPKPTPEPEPERTHTTPPPLPVEPELETVESGSDRKPNDPQKSGSPQDEEVADHTPSPTGNGLYVWLAGAAIVGVLAIIWLRSRSSK